jgi:hypothetical protein
MIISQGETDNTQLWEKLIGSVSRTVRSISGWTR